MNQVIRIDSIWKSLQIVNKNREERQIVFKDMFFVFDYDGLLYSKSVNTTFKNYQQSKTCPYQGQFNFDARCRFYYNKTLNSTHTVIIQPEIVYSNNQPSIAQSFCQRNLKFNEQDSQKQSQNHSILCLSQDLSIIPLYLKNFGSNSKLQIILNPYYQTVIYHSEQKQNGTKILTIQQAETDYLQDQNEAQKFIQLISKDNQLVLNTTNNLDLVGFDYNNQVEVFEYQRNETECMVIKNIITIADKVSKQEILRQKDQQLPKYEIKNAFLFLNILSKEKMQQYSSHLQEQIEYYSVLFILITLALMIILLSVQIIYAFQLGEQTLKPVTHLTNILKQISQKNKRKKQNDIQSGKILSTDDIIVNVRKMLRTSCQVSHDYFQMNQDELCYSHDTQQLFNSFKNLFQVLAFTTQNIYKENESASLINLSIEIQHFNKFDNHRALGVCYNNIGVIHYNCGRYYESIENFQRSIIYAKYELGFYENSSYLLQNDDSSIDQLNKDKQNATNQNNLEDSFTENRDKSQIQNDENKKLIEQDKVFLLWNLYNRTINLIKAFFFHINEKGQAEQSEFLEEIILETQEFSQQYFPNCLKREMMQCFLCCIVYRLQNKQNEFFDTLQKFQNLYIRNRLNKKNNSKELNSVNTISRQNINQVINEPETTQSLFYYSNDMHSLLDSPIYQVRQIKKNGLFDKYKQNQEKEINKDTKDENKFKQNLFFKKIERKNQTKIQIQDQLMGKIQQLKQQLIMQNPKKTVHYHQYFKIRKNQSQEKICKYQFSSDVLFQYYAIEQAKFQIMLKNYYNAGLIITNIFEKCFYYQPFIKIRALEIAINLFEKLNIQNPYLKEIFTKYINLIHANVKVCAISACVSKYSQFKSDAVQSDLINDILYKDKDQFGLISYCFKEKLYFQEVQMTSSKIILKNLKLFQKNGRDIKHLQNNLKTANISCMSQYSQFKSDAIQSDLINDILFKDKDHFGLIKYSFQEKIYEQQIQLTNIKLILKNYNTFYKTNQKSDVSVQSQKNISKKNIQNTLDKNCCLFSDKNETQRKNITLNLFKSNTLDVQHEDCFTFRQSQNQPSKQSNQEFYFQDNHEKSSYFQSQKLNKQISRNQFSINQIDQLNKSDNRNQTAESVQASQKLNFFNSNYKQEKTPRNFMKNYVLNPKISSVLKLPIENENFSQMLKDYEQDLQKIKQTPTYNSFTDPFHVQSSPKITNKYQLNFKDKENQRKKDSAFNQVSLSFLNEDQEKDLSIHRQENFQIQIDKQNSYQEMTESNQSSFFHNKSDHGDESKHNIMNNYSQRINKKMMSQTEFTYLDNIQLIEEQDFFNFSQESLFEEQKVQTNYTHPKQYVIPQF